MWYKIKRILVWTNQVRPYKPKTFTISWTEQSNMSSGWIYSDDAAWLTAGSTAFDDFFWYSAVLLNTSGVETAEMKQSWWVFTGAMSTLGNITSGDNVMIKFPVRWIKMSKSWSVITLSITEELGKSGYQYYAFQNTWDIESNTESTATRPLYLWTYLSYKSSNVLKSWSGQSPQWNNIMANELSYASANGTGRTIMWWYQRCLIDAYYMMKYWNPDCQSVVGRWYVDQNNTSVHSTWWTDNQTSATYGTSSNTVQCKLFWLEDRWGNQEQRIWWAFTDSSRNLYVALHNFTANRSTSESQYKNAWAITPSNSSYCLTGVLGTNKWMFWPKSSSSYNNYNYYYCDYVYVYQNCFGRVGWYWSWNANWNANWLFNTQFSKFDSSDSKDKSTTCGSRLMYL